MGWGLHTNNHAAGKLGYSRTDSLVPCTCSSSAETHGTHRARLTDFLVG
jgi:hypothetical protein